VTTRYTVDCLRWRQIEYDTGTTNHGSPFSIIDLVIRNFLINVATVMIIIMNENVCIDQ